MRREKGYSSNYVQCERGPVGREYNKYTMMQSFMVTGGEEGGGCYKREVGKGFLSAVRVVVDEGGVDFGVHVGDRFVIRIRGLRDV